MEKKGQRDQGKSLYFIATSDKRRGQSMLCWTIKTNFSNRPTALQSVVCTKALPASHLKRAI